MIYIYNELKELLAKVKLNNDNLPFRVGEIIGLNDKEYEICKITHILEKYCSEFCIRQVVILCKTIEK